MRYKRIRQFCEETGYSEAAVRAKLRDGVWLEGREYKKAPDGHILIDVEGYYAWVEKGDTKGFAQGQTTVLKSISATRGSAAARRSSSPQPLQT